MGAHPVAIATPMDKELASLSEKISTTYLCYGEMGREKAANQVAQDANAKQLSLAAAATRGTSKGGGLYRNSEWDLPGAVPVKIKKAEAGV